jgi:hypothetical protein
MLPVLGAESVEGEQRVAILGKGIESFSILTW